MRENAVLCYDGSRTSLGQILLPNWALGSHGLSQQTAERGMGREWERQDTATCPGRSRLASSRLLFSAAAGVDFWFFQLVGFLPLRTVNQNS